MFILCVNSKKNNAMDHRPGQTGAISKSTIFSTVSFVSGALVPPIPSAPEQHVAQGEGFAWEIV